MDYSRQADLARILLKRYGGPARIKRPASGEYDLAGDAALPPAAALAATMSETAMVLDLAGDLSEFPVCGLLRIDSELVFYSRIAGGRCSGLERGAEGTGASAHASAATATLTHACQETSAVALNYRREMIAGSLAEPGDRLVYLAAVKGMNPEPGDLLRLGGRDYRLEEVSGLAPDGTACVYYEARARATGEAA